LGTLALLCSIGAVVRAQGVPPGIAASLDVTQRLEYSDNPDLDVNGDSDLYGRTLLNFGLASDTKVQAFALNLGTEIEEFRDDNSNNLDPRNYFGTIRYDRNTRNARFGLRGEYRNTDVDGDITEEEFDQDSNVINQTEGTRKFYSIGVEGAVGREAPIGANFAWRYSEIKYDGGSNQEDNSTNDFRGQADFRIDPRITTNLTARYIDFDTNGDGVDRKTTGAGAGVVLEVSPILTTSISLSYDRIKRSGDETGTDKGISGVINVTRDMPNGSLGLTFESDVASNDNSRRSFLSVNRDMELPRGSLSYSLGVTSAGSAIGLNPLVDVNYTHIRPTQQISLGLSQRVNTDEDNNEEINTSLRASFDQQINNTSSFGINASFFNRNQLGDNQNDGRRFEVGLTYRHDLTRDWGLVGGYSYTRSTEDNDRDRNRNTIFVGLQRSFDWSP
jgi:hypothetical protein